jgi:large subunit ribosomal protein L21
MSESDPSTTGLTAETAPGLTAETAPVPAPSPAAAPASAPTAAPAAGDQTGTYVIVEASGQQFWLQPNRYLDLDRLAAEVDSTVTLENVLLVKDASGTILGQPYVTGATVELRVMAHRRGTKIMVYKMRPKKKTRRKNGHRQELTRVMVESIRVGGKAIS